MPRGRKSGPVNPLRGCPQTVQGAQHPELAALELSGQRLGLGELNSGGARGVEHEVHRHARDARHRISRTHERLALPPEQAAVGAFDDGAASIHDDRLAGAARLHGHAQGLQGVKVRTLYERLRARVMRGGRNDDFSARQGSRSKSQAQLGAVGAFSQLDPRKPVARAGECSENVTPKCFAVGAVSAS